MALTNAERQRIYIQRLRERAGMPAPRTFTSKRTEEALRKLEGKKAWQKVRAERRAYREAALGWRQRLDNLLRCAARGSREVQIIGHNPPLPIQGPRGEDYVKQEAWELFGVRWKP
jgi:hypothetical protein